MDIQVVVTLMAALFIVVIVGFVSRKTHLMGGDFDRSLSVFVIQVTCPALVLASTMGDRMPDRSHIPMLLLISAATYAILIILAYILPRLMGVKPELRGMYSFMLTYSNVGFIGYPIVASIFGSDAVFYACILNVFNTLTIFIFGVMFVTGESMKGGMDWKLFRSPAMIATYIAVIIVCLGWHAPKFISQPVSLVGNMTVPASLLIIGSSIADIPLKKMLGTPHTFIMCALKLFGLPILIFWLFSLCGMDHRLNSINMILIAMPVASFGTMFCLRYGKDETAMSQGTFWSTLLSVISIPLLALLTQ